MQNNKNPRFDNKTEEIIVDRNKAYNRWTTFKTQDLYLIFRELRLKVNKEINKTKFFKDKFNGAIGS